MTSFLVVSPLESQRSDYIKTLLTKNAIHLLDTTIVNKQTSDKTTQSIGIEEIQSVKQKIFFKPLKGKTKALIIEDAHFLTIEAQNALLKLLEEPPEHTIIVLTTDSQDLLIPTILSRCSIIAFTNKAQPAFTDEEKKQYSEFLISLSNSSLSQKLKTAETLSKNRDQGIQYITEIILFIREELLTLINVTNHQEKEKLYSYHLIITRLTRLVTLLKTTNVNARFALENTLLSL